ncbi:unnamed protein product, partial [Laminaria digitata]
MKTEVGRALVEAAMTVGNTARETPSRRAGSTAGGGGSSVARVDEEEEEEKGCSPSLSTSSFPTPGHVSAEGGESPRGGSGRSTDPRD